MTWQHVVMMGVGLMFMYLAVGRKKEPFLLLPLSVGILLANIPGANLSAYFDPNDLSLQGAGPGLFSFIYKGVRPLPNASAIYPPLIFLCLGTITDFAPLIASPRTALIGLAAQIGIVVALGLALLTKYIPGFEGFTLKEAAAIGIIGGADGPTAIYTSNRLAPDLLPTIAIAAFSYMGLVPFIQPPIMRMLTTPKERVVVMPEPKHVTQRQKILFPVGIMVVIITLVPQSGVLIGMFAAGNLIRECGMLSRYVNSLSNAVLDFLSILLALSIGSSTTADKFLTPQTLLVLFLGLVAFAFGTVGGVLIAKLMYYITGGKVNPLIGNAGVSAVPMAARISQRLGQEYNHQNHLLMHAMGALVAGVLGSAMVAGIFISLSQYW
ncbi:MAG: sodium ion-translocating decarboxylase subunit beta [Kiritimatiellaeota bacterium]|nr:sodium ion-translocating decarboxylase subunit beta [Kiritimatiellota bacterium]